MTTTTREAQLFLLTADGLVRCRLNGAQEPEVLDTKLQGENMRAVCQDPVDPSHLYAASVTEVFSSTNGGESWRLLPAGGLDYREIWTMSVHPTRAKELYVGTLPAAVFVSRDGGLSFEELSGFRSLPDYGLWTFPPPPRTAHIRSIVLDARVPDEIVVGVEEGGVVRSFDGGVTWTDASGPVSRAAFPEHNDVTGQLPYEEGHREDGRVYRDVHTVIRHPGELETLFASTGLGTYKTSDGGGRWEWMGNGMPLRYSVCFAAHPSAPERLYLGASENSPPTWKGHRTVRTGPFNVSSFAPDMSEKLGGAQCTVFRSDDAGESWHVLDNGLPVAAPAMVCAIKVHPDDPDTLFVGYTDGATYLSRNAGESWSELGITQDKLYGLVIAPPVS